MIEEILPPGVAAVDTREDLLDISLFPEEERALGRGAVDKRRREFVTARACAREALRKLGLPPVAIPTGARGEPCWPAGVVGSITHCAGYRACAVARAEALVTVGIDAEPNERLPHGVLAEIARAEEREMLGELALLEPSVHWDRLLFSAKEAVYKAWFPLAERWLGFEDATVSFDHSAGAFEARLLVIGPTVGAERLRSLGGRFLVRSDLVLTAVSLSPKDSELASWPNSQRDFRA